MQGTGRAGYAFHATAVDTVLRVVDVPEYGLVLAFDVGNARRQLFTPCHQGHVAALARKNIHLGLATDYRRAQLLVRVDKSVWPLAGLDPDPLPGLGAGDRVRIECRPGNNGSIAVEDLIVTFR